MVYMPDNLDKMKLMSLYAFGLADPPRASVSISSIEEVSKAFTTNILRLKSMMVFPAFLADFAGILQRITVRAEFETAGEVTIQEIARDTKSAKVIFDRFKALYHEHSEQLQEMANDPIKISTHTDESVERGGAITVLLSNGPASVNAFEFAMMSYLTSAWTAFETAASDLWEVALNHRPQGLAELSGERRYRKRETRKSGEEDIPKLEKSIKLELIRGHEWDTRNKMGSILRDKFSFTSLSGIREAYECAFYKKSDNIDAVILDDCFDQLSALRNVIVHKSAIADSEYVQKAKKIPSLPQFKKGEKIELNGKMVADLVHKTTNASCKLLYEVDQWLIKNAIKPPEVIG